MAEPLPRLSLYVLLRSTARMWLTATALTLVGWLITHGWLGSRLRAVSDQAARFDQAHWMSARQIQALVAEYTPAMKAAQLPFSLADYLCSAMVALWMAITMGWLMLKAPNRISEALALGHVFWLPLSSAAFEWAENGGFLYLLHAYPASHAWIAEATSVFKTCHTIATFSSLALIGLLAVMALLHRLSRRP